MISGKQYPHVQITEEGYVVTKGIAEASVNSSIKYSA